MSFPDNDVDTLNPASNLNKIAAPPIISIAVPVVTAASAYVANNVVGGLLTFNNFPSAGSIRSAHLKMASVQTAEFDLYLFNALPNLTTWTDKTAPAINAGDVTKLVGILKFTANASGLGTHTIYNLDSIGRTTVPGVNTIYGVLVTKGTPTFTATSDILGVALVVDPH
jgi:hypothetical protein